MTDATIIERMDAALGRLAKQWGNRRWPKAFYLGPDDWADFIAVCSETVSALRGNEIEVGPGFKGIPVRRSVNVGPRVSRLYNNRASGSRV